MPGLGQTKQALHKLEQLKEMIRQAEVELRESAYYPSPEVNHHLSVAASNLVEAEKALRSVLEILERPS